MKPIPQFVSGRPAAINLFWDVCRASGLLHKRFCQIVPFALASLVAPPCEAQVATLSALGNPGTVSGSVLVGESRAPVEGAVVTVVNSTSSATTDRLGRFELSDVPAGRQSLTITGANLQPMRVEDVVVEGGKGLTLSPISGVVLGAGVVRRDELVVRAGTDVVTLSRVVVEGYRAGRSRAVQQKQEAANVLDIISADAIGNLPDRNVAEAVARLPGVNAAPLDGPFDQPQGGEGRYVSIRGVDPNLNQVLVDGNTMSAPGGTRLGRAVPLDVLGATQIAQIEVIKSSTPDMDGNSLGGTINVKTASAFDRKERFIQGSATVNYNETSEKTSPSFDVSYGDVFGSNRQWGIALSATSDKRSYGQERLNFSPPLQNTVGGVSFLLPTLMEFRPTWGYRLNGGVTMNLEYRPTERTQLFLRSIVNQSKTEQNWDEFRLDSGGTTNTITLTSDTSGIFSAARTQARYREMRQVRSQALYNIATGLKQVIGQLTIEPTVSYSYAEEVRDSLSRIDWQTTRGALGRLEFELKPGERYPSRWEGLDGAWTDPSKYQFASRHIDDGGVIEDETLGAKLDVRWNPEKILGGTGFIKVGGKATRRDRFVDLISNRLSRLGQWTLASIPNGVGPGRSLYDGRYHTGFSLNRTNVWNYIEQNPALTTFDVVGSGTNSIEDDYDIVEDIYAAYAMGNVQFGPLTILGGLRWERTEATIGAVENRFANGVNLGRFPIVGSTSYNSYFPNLQAVFRPTKRLALRGAVTQSIGRPAYEDARPLSTFRFDEILGDAALDPAYPYAGSLTIGNPGLKPYKSVNYDLSLEYYMKGGAMVSAAFFRKDISDPIYAFSEIRENVIHSGVGLERLNYSTRLNAESGRINGLEFSLYQPFRFLRAPFDGLGVEANFTVISSEVVVITRPGENLPFFRQPDKIRNFTLFYEKHRFSGRVSFSYTDGMMTSISSAAATDNWSDPLKRVDAQVSYRITPNYSVRLAARNLTGERENYSFGKGGPLRETYLVGRSYTFGVSVNY